MAETHNDSSDEQDSYEVEAIRDKLVGKNGKVSYFIKWKGFAEEENSWEPVDNLHCPELIAKFEKELREKKKKPDSKKKSVEPKKEDDSKKVDAKKDGMATKKKQDSHSKKKLDKENLESLRRKRSNGDTSSSNCNSSKKQKSNSDEETEEPVGFARGLKPFKIMGATEVDGELKFLMAWNGIDTTDMVLAKEANAKCPQLVIDFYEERLTWHNIDDNKKGKK